MLIVCYVLSATSFSTTSLLSSALLLLKVAAKAVSASRSDGVMKSSRSNTPLGVFAALIKKKNDKNAKRGRTIDGRRGGVRFGFHPP